MRTELVEWWIDESSLPNFVWARVRVLGDGRTEVLDSDGSSRVFACQADAATHLLEDEYVRPGWLDPEELHTLGLVAQDLVPPTAQGGPELRTQMRVRCDHNAVILGLAAVRWQAPWRPVTREERNQLEHQLRKELDRSHALYGRRAQAFLRRSDRDDALFLLSDPAELALVHLTFSSTVPQLPPWPRSETFEHVWQFVERARADAAEYELG